MILPKHKVHSQTPLSYSADNEGTCSRRHRTSRRDTQGGEASLGGGQPCPPFLPRDSSLSPGSHPAGSDAQLCARHAPRKPRRATNRSHLEGAASCILQGDTLTLLSRAGIRRGRNGRGAIRQRSVVLPLPRSGHMSLTRRQIWTDSRWRCKVRAVPRRVRKRCSCVSCSAQRANTRRPTRWICRCFSTLVCPVCGILKLSGGRGFGAGQRALGIVATAERCFVGDGWT